MIHVLESVININLINAIAATWPKIDWPHWHRYNDEYADKYASKDAHRIPDAAKLAINQLASLRPFNNTECFPDLDLHGAGLHMCMPNGRLGLHLDGATHPITGWSRVANAILFIDDWDESWGGALQMFDADAKKVIKEVYPKRGRVVLFETTETAWHQVANVIGPKPRRSLSLFWWSEQPPTSPRNRAQFVVDGA